MNSNLSQSPTLSMVATQQGVMFGTAAYMSPEQAKGKPVAKRADISVQNSLNCRDRADGLQYTVGNLNDDSDRCLFKSCYRKSLAIDIRLHLNMPRVGFRMNGYDDTANEGHRHSPSLRRCRFSLPGDAS